MEKKELFVLILFAAAVVLGVLLCNNFFALLFTRIAFKVTKAVFRGILSLVFIALFIIGIVILAKKTK